MILMYYVYKTYIDKNGLGLTYDGHEGLILQDCIVTAVDRYHAYQDACFHKTETKYKIGEKLGDIYSSAVIDYFTAYVKQELLQRTKIQRKADMKLSKEYNNHHHLEHEEIVENVERLNSVFLFLDEKQKDFSCGLPRKSPDEHHQKNIEKSIMMKKVLERFCYRAIEEGFRRAGMEGYVLKQKAIRINEFDPFRVKDYTKWQQDYEDYLEGGYWYNYDRRHHPEEFEGDGFYARLKVEHDSYYERYAQVSTLYKSYILFK
jgi:hypothetical protein